MFQGISADVDANMWRDMEAHLNNGKLPEENKKKEKVKINFLYGLNIKNIKEFIIWMDKRSKILKDRTIAENLESVINYKLVDVFLKLVNISKSTKWNNFY